MIRRGILAWLVVMGCSSDAEVKIDYTVSFTDENNKDLGVVQSGSLKGVQATVPVTALKASTAAPTTATFEVKSDTAGLHFLIVEDGVRKGLLSCAAQPGTGSATARANITTGGHYLIATSFSGMHCIAEQ